MCKQFWPYLFSHESCISSSEQRIQDIKFWRQELDQKFEEMVQEIETLIIYKSRVERALESCSEPFQVTLQCLTERYSTSHCRAQPVEDNTKIKSFTWPTQPNASKVTAKTFTFQINVIILNYWTMSVPQTEAGGDWPCAWWGGRGAVEGEGSDWRSDGPASANTGADQWADQVGGTVIRLIWESRD